MTIDRTKTIKIPTWILTIAGPVLLAFLTSYGTVINFQATTDTKMERAIEDIKKLDSEKVGRQELNLILKSLERIEKKVDDMSAQKK